MVKGLKVFLVVLCLGVWTPGPLAAQTLPGITLSLDKNYYGRSDQFTATGTVINTSSKHAGNADLALKILPVLDRGEPLFDPGRARKEPVLRKEWRRSLGVGLTKITLTQSLEELNLEEGVYPLEFSLSFPDHQTLVDKSFLVVIGPNRQQLPVAVVWSLYPGEHRLPDGRFTGNGLAEMIKRTPHDPGPLNRHLDLIEENASLKINLAAGPTLTGQLSAMAEGYKWFDGETTHKSTRDSSAAVDARTWLDRVNGLAGAGRLELLASPYGEAPLPLLNSLGWGADTRNQIEMVADYQPLPNQAVHGGFYIPGLTADSRTARLLTQSGFAYTVTVDQDAADKAQAPQTPRKFADNGQSIAVFSADTEIADWLSAAAPEKAGVELTAILAQRLFLYEDTNIVVMTPSANSPPRVELTGRIYEVLSGLPWIETVPLSSAIGAASKPAVLPKEQEPLDVGRAYRGKIAAGRSLWLNFAGAVPANNPVSNRLERWLYRSQSVDFLTASGGGSNQAGEAYISAINRTIKTELGKIKLLPPRTIAFSTRRGKVPIAVFNGAGYPIETQVDIEGKDFSFPDDMKGKIVLKPKENLISYDVEAVFDGLGSLNVKISVGDFAIASQSIEVTVSSVLRYVVVGGTTLLVVSLGAMLLWRRRKE